MPQVSSLLIYEICSPKFPVDVQTVKIKLNAVGKFNATWRPSPPVNFGSIFLVCSELYMLSATALSSFFALLSHMNLHHLTLAALYRTWFSITNGCGHAISHVHGDLRGNISTAKYLLTAKYQLSST